MTLRESVTINNIFIASAYPPVKIGTFCGTFIATAGHDTYCMGFMHVIVQYPH